LNTRLLLVRRALILFDNYLVCIRLIDAGLPCTIAPAWLASAAHAAQLIVPSAVGMVFAHPADTETNGTVLIDERAAPAPEIAGIPREATLSFMARQNNPNSGK
jgi:hypothetical protein